MRYYFYKDEDGILQASKKEVVGVCAVWEGEVGHNIYAVCNNDNNNIVVSENELDIAAYLAYDRFSGFRFPLAHARCEQLVTFQWCRVDSGFELEKLFTMQVKGGGKPIFEASWSNVGKIHQFKVIDLFNPSSSTDREIGDNIKQSVEMKLWYYDNDDSILISTQEPYAVSRKFCLTRNIYVNMSDFAGMIDKAGHIYVVYYDYSDVDGTISKNDDTTFIAGNYAEFVHELRYRIDKSKSDTDARKKIKAGVFKVCKHERTEELYTKPLFTVCTTGRVDIQARDIDYNMLSSVCTQVLAEAQVSKETQ